MSPKLLARSLSSGEAEQMSEADGESRDSSHLRSTAEVSRYRVSGDERDFARTDDFVMDEESWQITGIVVSARRDFLAPRRYLIEPGNLTGMSWSESRMYVDLPQELLEEKRRKEQGAEASRYGPSVRTIPHPPGGFRRLRRRRFRT
jgi:hypothetical protein